MGVAATPSFQEQSQTELPLWRGNAPFDGTQATGYVQEDQFAKEKQELNDFLARQEEMAATANFLGQAAMQQGFNPMMQSAPMFMEGATQQIMQPDLQSMQQQQQPQQIGTDGTAAAMQLMNSLQQLASAVSQASGQ